MPRNLFQYHPVVGYRFIPGIRARVRHEGGGYLVRSNAQGFRSDRDFVPARRPGVTRVLVFGDSYTAGEGVHNEDRFSDGLEARLAGTEVFNFGLPGSGTDQQFLAYREFARELEHDILVLCPMVENVRRNIQRERLTHSVFDGRLVARPKPYFEIEDGELALRNSPVPKARPSDEAKADASPDSDPPVGAARQAARAVTRAIDERLPGFRSWTQRVRGLALPEEYNDAGNSGWRLMRAILEQWIAESPARVVLCPIPTFGHIEGGLDPRPYLERFGEVSGDFEFLDLLPALKKASNEDREALRFSRDEHPTPRCHEVIAGELASRLTQLGLAGTEDR